MAIWLVFFFILGTIVGSFLNVLVLRYGLRTVRGRSGCLSCGKVLAWHELIPIVSFFVQRGRCRGCKVRISSQYPLVELATGLVFGAVAWKESAILLSSLSLSPIVYLLLSLLLWSLLIALSVYDIRHKIIPDALVYGAALVSLGVMLLVPGFREQPLAYRDFWSGVLFALPFAALWFFSKGRAIGLGDAKLVVMFPWLLGVAEGLSALLVGFWIGALASLALLSLKSLSFLLPKNAAPGLKTRLRSLTMKSELPLAPFLVLGLLIVYLTGLDATGLSMLLEG